MKLLGKAALTTLEFADLSDLPKVTTDIPFVRIGDRLNLAFSLERKHGGRTEVLKLAGEFRVSGMILSVNPQGARQIVQVLSIGVAPAWKAIKNKVSPSKRLSPAVSKRTLIV
jgi:hypothetical protein